MEGNNGLSDAKGAYTNVIVYALNKNNFFDVVRAEFDYRRYDVIDIEDVEQFSERANKYILRNELLELAQLVELTGEAGIDTFHLYDNDETLI
jgi:hypothetical protein